MASNEKIIWDYFKAKGFSDAGIAGLMGNLYAESGLIPNNMQNSFEKKLGYNDATYTQAVDNGTYTNFVRDGCGYGLAQWTYWSRKQNLLDFCKSKNKSVGDLNTQLDFLYQELNSGYSAIVKILKTTTSVKDASNEILLKFERPADQSAAVQNKRATYGQGYYDKYAPKKEVTQMSSSNSPLVTYTLLSPNYTKMTNKVNDTITIHCFVGQVSAKRGCEVFQPTSKQASCNYVVGYDGGIGLCVEEKSRSWCSGGSYTVNGETGSQNDRHAITIEVACEATHPYAVTDAAYQALIKLVADIAKRNNMGELKWKADKSLVGKPQLQNMTVHRWFAAKACPGDYLYNRLGDIAAKANAINAAAATPIGPAIIEEDDDMTQEKFNEMMNIYLAEQAKLPATWEKAALEWAKQAGIMQGNETGNLMPKKFLTRGEAATMLQRISLPAPAAGNYVTKEEVLAMLNSLVAQMGGK